MKRVVLILAVLGLPVVAYAAGAAHGDRTGALVASATWSGLIMFGVGVGAGMVWARALRGWRDYIDARGKVRFWRGALPGHAGSAVRWVLVAGLIVAVGIAMLNQSNGH